MKRLKLFSLFLLLLIGVGQVWAEKATLTLSSTKKFSTASGSTLTDDKNNTWTVTTTTGAINGAYQSGYHGEQFGSSNGKWKGKFTASIDGTITSVKVDANTGGSNTKLSVKVGATSFKYNNNDEVTVTKNSSANAATWYEFTGSATGDIEISFGEYTASKACYFGGVVVTYTPNGSNKPTLFMDHRERPSNSLIYNPVITFR